MLSKAKLEIEVYYHLTKRFLKQLFCIHQYVHTWYGDPIELHKHCIKCNKEKY